MFRKYDNKATTSVLQRFRFRLGPGIAQIWFHSCIPWYDTTLRLYDMRPCFAVESIDQAFERRDDGRVAGFLHNRITDSTFGPMLPAAN